ncbi:MAG: hypothetical protein IT367_19085 [Candidatus Hydrogenedentes bacterium]|nr:hypothetical protein [Candidatus Hydrogenedentota bacterium]
MQVHDYNGTGRWSKEGIQQRYLEYRQKLGLPIIDAPFPQVHVDAENTWIYPLMDKVIEGIKSGDQACVLIGIDFIEEDGKFPFGKGLKSNTARALRRAALTEDDKKRIRRRVVDMLQTGNTPREFSDYSKLLKTVGLGDCQVLVESLSKSQNPHVKQHVNYLLNRN